MVSRHWPAYLAIAGLGIALSCLIALGFKSHPHELAITPPIAPSQDFDRQATPPSIDPVQADPLTAARATSGGA